MSPQVMVPTAGDGQYWLHLTWNSHTLSHTAHNTATQEVSDLAQLHQVGQHDDSGCVTFPYHTPEVGHSLVQGALGGNVFLGLIEALQEAAEG